MNEDAPFESPKLLIDSAKKSLVDFKSGNDRFVQLSHYDVFDYPDFKTGEQVVSLRFKHRIPSEIRVLSYHIVNDLRNALDQAVGDGAIALGRPDSKGVYFPFGKSVDDFRSALRNRCRNVDQTIIKFIEALNPHYGGDNILYELSRMPGPNKHQKILSLFGEHNGFILGGGKGASGMFIQGPASIGINKWNDRKNELEFARIGKGGHMQMNIVVPIKIVISDAPVFAGQPAVAVFEQLIGKVESIVLGIEAETSRVLLARKI